MAISALMKSDVFFFYLGEIIENNVSVVLNCETIT